MYDVSSFFKVCSNWNWKTLLVASYVCRIIIDFIINSAGCIACILPLLLAVARKSAIIQCQLYQEIFLSLALLASSLSQVAFMKHYTLPCYP